MPCGKRPLIKTWDKPKKLRLEKPSRYQQNEASVKIYWKNVTKNLEAAYKDERFWDSHTNIVRELVGPVIFERLAKIFQLPPSDELYVPMSEPSTVEPSEQFYQYIPSSMSKIKSGKLGSILSFVSIEEEIEEEGEEEQTQSESTDWTMSSSGSSTIQETKKSSHSKTAVPKKSIAASKTKSQTLSYSKIQSMVMSKTFNRSAVAQKSFSNKFLDTGTQSSTDVSAFTEDDVLVHVISQIRGRPRRTKISPKSIYNPHFELLYCNESETDMIKWNSKYKKKAFEVSASDEYSKKAELVTKQIAHEFYDWWTDVGSHDYKSEIKCPEDLESLFQIWFDEHASRGLVLDPKILPCVLESIAQYIGVPKAACSKALKRQIAWDIRAETSPAHTRAFNTSLPLRLRHIPPRNNTKEVWKPIPIPEDLQTMSAIWEDIAHLTSTKSFTKWLQQHPELPMPPFLKQLSEAGEKKQRFVVPSDIYVRAKSVESVEGQELNIPVSQFSMEIKEVLSKLLND